MVDAHHRAARRGIGFTWLAIALAAPLGIADGVYQEEGGLLVMEMESANPGGQWIHETDFAGFTGSAYVRWDGANYFNDPGHDVFEFEFEIHQPGTYQLRIRNRHEDADSSEENDVWVRMDGGSWVKAFSGDNNGWNWLTNHDFSSSNKPPAEYDLSAGHHVIAFSGRSTNFMMDRFHLFVEGHPDGTNETAPESAVTGGSNTRPVAMLRITPSSIPATDNGSTVVTLDGLNSYDPDEGQELTFNWQVRGATFVEGTTASSPLARITLQGGHVMPVKLTVTDNGSPARSRTLHGAINVSGTEGFVTGEPVAWHTMEIWFHGPAASETGQSPNPFLDYRLIVAFTGPGGQTFNVHGFYDGDGLGDDTGDVWKVRFRANRAGVWRYVASFRSGANVAINTNASAGTAMAFDGASGQIFVLARDPNADGFLSQGALQYVGEHYLKFSDGGYFLKGGTDSPENFLGYMGFDDIEDNGNVGIIHEYGPHVQDYEPGDPWFESNTTGYDARGIIGALNYLSSAHVNSIYFLPMNLGGDGQETCPFVGYENTSFNKRHYDISRMQQWNTVFEHAQRKGILLHFVLAETESANENWLDGGNLGVERKLFYREMAARFGHNLALKWNLSEENDYSITELQDFASYIDYVDPYDHSIAVHTHVNNFGDYNSILGNDLFTSTSIQYDPNQAGNFVEDWRENSANAGHKWVLDMDENSPASSGLTDSNADDLRKRVLYDVYFSGGQIEWYMGYHSLPLGGDLRCENFRTREEMWNYMWYARKLLQTHMPFWEMQPADELLTSESTSYGGGQVFAKQGTMYAIYLPRADDTGQLDLSGAPGPLRKRWYNPRTGALEGEPSVVMGGGSLNLGTPPSDPSEDWVVLLSSQRH
ncbi:MAG: DUF5060 domain-containing protein [Planctomycetota bacterium]|nr:MAG: DUF5060 domain-containing protein [Planctomycetota bacterium]